MIDNMIGDIDIKKYGIQSISMISEASFAPKIIFKHFNKKEYSYTPSKEYVDRIRNSDSTVMFDIVSEHIKVYCIKYVRKEKLEKINLSL